MIKFFDLKPSLNQKTMLSKIRYYFESISIPIFTLLTFHLSLSGVNLLLNIPVEHEYNHNEFTYTSFIISLILLGLFIFIWHRPQLKKWVPCSHEHCHNEQNILHAIAIFALCLHFFPEAQLRQQVLTHMSHQYDWLLLLGFASHFIVDIVVMIFISSYWKTPVKITISISIIILVWGIAFFSAQQFSNNFNILENPYLLLISSFLLAMFIHKPHKPI